MPCLPIDPIRIPPFPLRSSRTFSPSPCSPVHGLTHSLEHMTTGRYVGRYCGRYRGRRHRRRYCGLHDCGDCGRPARNAQPEYPAVLPDRSDRPERPTGTRPAMSPITSPHCDAAGNRRNPATVSAPFAKPSGISLQLPKDGRTTAYPPSLCRSGRSMHLPLHPGDHFMRSLKANPKIQSGTPANAHTMRHAGRVVRHADRASRGPPL